MRLSRSIRAALPVLCAATLLSACASTVTRLPDITPGALRAESFRQEAQALAVQADHTQRLLNVGWKIFAANAELCENTTPDLGILLHTEETYPREFRQAAKRELGAMREPSIHKIAAGSPADRAGLQTGDVILTDDGYAMGAHALREALDVETVDLTVRRDDELLSVPVQPEIICRSRLHLRGGSSVNAFATGRQITVTIGMMRFAQSDDELALIIGHELAHNTMGHIRKVFGNFILSGFSTRYTRVFESEADYVGLYYMVRAGFDPDGVEDFWRRLAGVDPRSVKRAKTHPTFPDRFLRIEAAQMEIQAKQAAGEPLVPNFKDDE